MTYMMFQSSVLDQDSRITNSDPEEAEMEDEPNETVAR